jgi:hypothetical protein
MTIVFYIHEWFYVLLRVDSQIRQMLFKEVELPVPMSKKHVAAAIDTGFVIGVNPWKFANGRYG